MNNEDDFSIPVQPFLPSAIKSANLDRLVYVQGQFDEYLAQSTIMSLLELSSQDTKTPIVMMIDSFGGEVYSSLPIVDIIESLPNELYTVVAGKAMSAAAILAICGTKGHRYILKNSTMMLHQIRYTDSGSLSEMKLSHDEANKLQTVFDKIVTTKTLIEKENIREYVNSYAKNFYSHEAIKFGLCDEVINKKNLKNILKIIAVKPSEFQYVES